MSETTPPAWDMSMAGDWLLSIQPPKTLTFCAPNGDTMTMGDDGLTYRSKTAGNFRLNGKGLELLPPESP